jgi:O-antigen ligase
VVDGYKQSRGVGHELRFQAVVSSVTVAGRGVDGIPARPPAQLQPRVYALVSLTVLASLLSGVVLAVVGITYTLVGVVALGALVVLPLLFSLRVDETVAVVIVAVNLLIDWYQLVDATQLLRLPIHISVLSTGIALMMVGVMYFGRSPSKPWVSVPYLALWVLVLVFAVYPMLQGQTATGAVKYYINVFVDGILMYIIGTQIGADAERVRRLLALVAGFGAVVALHTVIYVKTGAFLLATHVLNDYLQTRGDFALGGGGQSRAGSFLYNPDMNGAFLAPMLLLTIGLLSASRSIRWKFVYVAETALIMTALLFTYSTAAWAAMLAGVVIFVLFVSRGRQRWMLLGLICAFCLLTLLTFQTELKSFLHHASNPNELTLREGGWLTAIAVIMAYPFTGIGLDPGAYQQLSQPYRAAQEYVALGHPHEAYLELAALAGLPVLILLGFIVLAGLKRALRNMLGAPREYRGVIGGGAVGLIVLSINSLAINGWTISPLVVIAWLVLGAIASPGWAEERQETVAAGEPSQPVPHSVGTVPGRRRELTA